MEEIKVKVGQIWQDDDPRSSHAKLKILEVDCKYAICQRGARKTRIRLGRFRPGSTGYRLVQDVPDVPDDDGRKLLFGDLAVGDYFIGFPTPGDNRGHGGYLIGHHVFKKTDRIASGESAPASSGSAVDGRGVTSYFPHSMPVIWVLIQSPGFSV